MKELCMKLIIETSLLSTLSYLISMVFWKHEIVMLMYDYWNKSIVNIVKFNLNGFLKTRNRDANILKVHSTGRRARERQ